MACRRPGQGEGDRAEAAGLGKDKALLVPGEQHAQIVALRTQSGDDRSDVTLELLAAVGETHGRTGALESRQVLGQRERTTAVDAHELEGAVAAQQALV